MAQEDYMRNSQVGQIAGSILAGRGKDKDDNFKKALLASALEELFKNFKQMRKTKVDNTVREIEGSSVIDMSRNKAVWERRNEILEKDKLIKKGGAVKTFSPEAESWFNNPENHKEIKNFNPAEFEDIDSPMYKVKTKEIQEYVNNVLLPTHNKKMENIDTNILTFEEFNKPLIDRTKTETNYAQRGSETSLIKKGLSYLGVGKGQEVRMKSAIENAKAEEKRLNTKRETILSDDLYVIKTLGKNTPNIIKLEGAYSGLTTDERLLGERYTLDEFKRSDYFKEIKGNAAAQLYAINTFKENEITNDFNNEEEILNIVATSQLLTAEETMSKTYTILKENDKEFLQSKPKRNSGENVEAYNKRKDVVDWKEGLDNAYVKGSIKDIETKKKAGYDLTTVEVYKTEIEEMVLYDKQTMIDKDNLKNNTLTQEEFNDNLESRKLKLITGLVQRDLYNPTAIEQVTEGYLVDGLSGITNFFNSAEGVQAISNHKIFLETTNEGLTFTREEARESLRKNRMNNLTKDYNYWKEKLTINELGEVVSSDSALVDTSTLPIN